MSSAIPERTLVPACSFVPLIGEGVAQNGGRWNRKGMKSLHHAADPMTAVSEYIHDSQFRSVTPVQDRSIVLWRWNEKGGGKLLAALPQICKISSRHSHLARLTLGGRPCSMNVSGT